MKEHFLDPKDLISIIGFLETYNPARDTKSFRAGVRRVAYHNMPLPCLRKSQGVESATLFPRGGKLPMKESCDRAVDRWERHSNFLKRPTTKHETQTLHRRLDGKILQRRPCI